MPHHGYTANISTPKLCDLCKVEEGNEVVAIYDASIRHARGRMWANVCDRHMAEGEGQLGTGRGQRLVVES